MVGPLVAKVSWGNDSIALVAWLTEHYPSTGEPRMAIHNITGWHSAAWPSRRERCRRWAESLGWVVIETERSLVQLSLKPAQSGFPGTARPWCTNALKIEPTRIALETIDPNREATVCLGVRREESARRRDFPEHQSANITPEGRDVWAPLVRMREDERNAILRRHGFEPLPHRSKE
jgi:3'-phosphoadenosine 5'-phosphosulfate sulfotransferase (PAPS reductase)/FAD synthetase